MAKKAAAAVPRVEAPEFAVRREHLLERLTVSEIEVRKPGAVATSEGGAARRARSIGLTALDEGEGGQLCAAVSEKEDLPTESRGAGLPR